MKDTKKMEFGKNLKKAAGDGLVFPVLIMTQPSFPSMKPVVPFKYKVEASQCLCW